MVTAQTITPHRAVQPVCQPQCVGEERAGEGNALLPELAGFEELVKFESLSGNYFDTSPLSIISLQLLNNLNQFEQDSEFDARRFSLE